MSQFSTTQMQGKNRQASMKLELADSKKTAPDLLFAGMKGEEKLGRPFRYVVRVMTQSSGSPNSPMVLTEEQWDSMLGGIVTITLKISNSPMNSAKRYFHGYIEQISHEGHVGNTGVSVYTLTLVPKINFLKYNKVNRIFLEEKIPDIIEQVLVHGGLGKDQDFKFDTTNTDYAEREMVVQYGESDFVFLHRLMEQVGIAYYFEHKSDEHTMVFTDAKSVAPKVTAVTGGQSDSDVKIQYKHSTQWKTDQVGIWRYRSTARMNTLAVSGSYYDFENASSLNKSTAVEVHETSPDYAINRDWMKTVEYPIGHMAAGQEGHATSWTGDFETKAHANRLGVQNEIRSVSGNYRLFSTGHQFELEGHPHAHENRTYQTIGMKFRIGTEDYPIPHPHKNNPGKQHAHDKIFSVSMKVLPTSTAFAPPVITHRYLIHGVQTATVVKSSESEKTVDTDEYGRVYVQFHWNSTGYALDDNDETQRTALVRVSQFWAGHSRGALFTPRVGDEVLVAFLNGDPDCPIIVGSLYNSVNEPFIKPAEAPLVSGLRTRVTTTSEDKLESDYKSINHSDLLFDDLYSSETTGLTLRSFRNSAGSEYSFEADDEDNKNQVEDCAAFTIAAPEGEKKELLATINVGDDVSTVYKGNQSGAEAFMGKKIVTSVGALSSSTMNVYSISEFSVKISNLAIYSLTYENPICEIGIGPLNNKMETVFGKNEIRAGLPSGALGIAGMVANYAHWAATFASKDKAGVDEGILGIAEKIIEGGGMAIAIAGLFADCYDGASLMNVGEVVVRPGVVDLTSENRSEVKTNITMLPATMKMSSSAEEVEHTSITLSAQQISQSAATAALTSTCNMSAEEYSLSVSDLTSMTMAEGIVAVMAAKNTTSLMLGEEMALMATANGATALSLDPVWASMRTATGSCNVSNTCSSLVNAEAAVSIVPEEIDLCCGTGTFAVTPETVCLLGLSVLINSGEAPMAAEEVSVAGVVEIDATATASLAAGTTSSTATTTSTLAIADASEAEVDASKMQLVVYDAAMAARYAAGSAV